VGRQAGQGEAAGALRALTSPSSVSRRSRRAL
jgi:hypothetical protein